jgi:hypothetical protein
MKGASFSVVPTMHLEWYVFIKKTKNNGHANVMFEIISARETEMEAQANRRPTCVIK